MSLGKRIRDQPNNLTPTVNMQNSISCLQLKVAPQRGEMWKSLWVYETIWSKLHVSFIFFNNHKYSMPAVVVVTLQNINNALLLLLIANWLFVLTTVVACFLSPGWHWSIHLHLGSWHARARSGRGTCHRHRHYWTCFWKANVKSPTINNLFSFRHHMCIFVIASMAVLCLLLLF